MLECYNCKSFLSCLHNGQIHINDDMELQCDFHEKADKNEMRKEQVIDGIVYRRLISEEVEGEMAHRMLINDCENCNEKNVCETREMMNHYGLCCKMFTPYKPPKISDRFRAMTDEKLAHFLWQVQEGLRKASSEKAWLDWLHKTYGED